MIHIIVGDEAAKNLEAAFDLDENLRGEIVVLKDTLGIGPIHVQFEENHDPVRTEFWRIVSSHHILQKVEDKANIHSLLEKAKAEEEPVCFWLAPCVSDVCAYYWLLPIFKKYPDMLHTINIIALPFLNDKGQLFYPKNFSEVSPKEFSKTKRLLKKVTPAEYEVEGDEWMKLQNENSWVRIYEGGKKVSSKDVTYFDALLKSLLTAEFQKASKVINEVLKKSTQTVSHLFFEWRLRVLARSESIAVNGDLEKAVKDFEVKKFGETMLETSEESVTPE